ncbi:MAG: hypothetical protein Q9180_002699, partial [Flavoplaca navasiana]
VEEADRLNLETFIEATDLGKLTYEACGFVYAGTNYLESAKRNASPEWKALERDMQYVQQILVYLCTSSSGLYLLVYYQAPRLEKFEEFLPLQVQYEITKSILEGDELKGADGE